MTALCKHAKTLLITAALLMSSLAFPLNAQPDDEDNADGPAITIEFIVFKRTGDAGADEERWPEEPGIPPIDDALDPNDGETFNDAGIRRPGNRQLSDAVRRLNDDARYEVLVHEAYTVPEKDRNESPWLRLSLDQRVKPDPESMDSEVMGQEPREQRQAVFADQHHLLETIPEETREEDITQPDVARPLDGIIRVHRNRFFHVAADLLFNPAIELQTVDRLDPEARALERSRRIEDLLAGRIDFEEFHQEDQQEADTPFPGYRLTESRRLRLGQLHYFDHPRFGLLVRIDRPEN